MVTSAYCFRHHLGFHRKGGVSDEQQLSLLLERIDRSLFSDDPIPLPLAGRKLQVNSDWGRETP